MVVALAGYLGAMVVALVVLVVAWHNVLGPSQGEKAREPPHPIGAVAQDAAPAPPPQGGQWGPAVVHKAGESTDAAGADDARVAAAKATAAEKAKRLKQARYQKRKQQLARQQRDQQSSPPYSTALGYDQDRSSDRGRSGDFSSAPFNLFGQQRF